MDIKRQSNWQLQRISRQVFAGGGILPGTAKTQIIKTVIENIYLLWLFERVFLASVSWREDNPCLSYLAVERIPQFWQATDLPLMMTASLRNYFLYTSDLNWSWDLFTCNLLPQARAATSNCCPSAQGAGCWKDCSNVCGDTLLWIHSPVLSSSCACLKLGR